ncbi:hypothetical protein CC78DRAFT_574610 [Lojkania enalia]|uniref:Uncharacterized protein n=1 Tax=Lojkania enalia TaxID=147567 RepID=A0A9P4NAS3_9PLEO|nr:hypothetical protein CC78DRAFT_574610 [Didymosphaeria enalia]
MSAVPAQFVKRGFWVNLEQGAIMGQTITTDMQTGNLIVALLAVLTTLGTTHWWNLLMFAYHQFRADGRSADGLFRQQQALLRTLPAPSSLMADWIKLWWVWRKADRAFARSYLQMLLGLIFAVGTVAAGIFTSYVVSSANTQILVQSPFCAAPRLDRIFSIVEREDIDAPVSYQANIGAAARAYAQDCYQNSTILPQRCSGFTRPNIPFTANRIECPFPGMCVDIEMPGLQFDSGLVDFNDGFGMNLKSSDRVKFRKRTTCAQLRADDHYIIVNASDYYEPFTPGEEVMILFYGQNKMIDFPNATDYQSLFMSNITTQFQTWVRMAFQGAGQGRATTLIPLPGMETDQMDLAIITLWKNAVAYSGPVSDPLYAAHKIEEIELSNGQTVPAYFPDFPASIYQYCISRERASDYCTNLTGVPDKISPSMFPDASDVQIAAMQQVRTASITIDIVYSAGELQAGIQDLDYLMPSLPDDQWIREYMGWESTIWAAMQIQIADYAIGAEVRAPSVGPYVKNRTEMTGGEKELCSMQRMRNPGGFVNVNVFGLSFIIAFSIFVTILDLIMLRFLIYMKKLRHERLDRWIQDGTFQLQRRAYEADAQGVWDCLTREVPVTRLNERLSELPLESTAVLERQDQNHHIPGSESTLVVGEEEVREPK